MTCGFRLFLFGVPYSKGDTKSSWIAAMISITKSAKHVCFIPLRFSSPPLQKCSVRCELSIFVSPMMVFHIALQFFDDFVAGL